MTRPRGRRVHSHLQVSPSHYRNGNAVVPNRAVFVDVRTAHSPKAMRRAVGNRLGVLRDLEIMTTEGKKRQRLCWALIAALSPRQWVGGAPPCRCRSHCDTGKCTRDNR